MRVQIEGDLIASVVSGDLPGIDIPAALRDIPTARLRFNGQIFIDIVEVGQFYIDAAGVKHLLRLDPTWPRLSCAWDADLRLEGGQWNAVSPADARRSVLFAFAADLRWRREVAGVAATVGGETVTVSTARGDDRAALHMTYSALKDGLRADGATFNFADGKPRKVSNADMEAAVLAALAHVQSAFDLGERVYARIDAGEITAEAQIEAMFAAP